MGRPGPGRHIAVSSVIVGLAVLVLVVLSVALVLTGRRLWSPRTALPHERGTVLALTPRLRKVALTTHIVVSVGWLGAVAGFIAFAVVGLTSQDATMVRAADLMMALTGWSVIVPLCLAAFLTGLASSLGTPWGLFRHYWVVTKLLMNVFATVILLIYMQSLTYIASIAAQTPTSRVDLGALRDPSSVVHAGGTLLLVLVATVLSVYKPRGLTRYGRRQQSVLLGGGATPTPTRPQSSGILG